MSGILVAFISKTDRNNYGFHYYDKKYILANKKNYYIRLVKCPKCGDNTGIVIDCITLEAYCTECDFKGDAVNDLHIAFPGWRLDI